jgi:pantoate--beta-alanine ligase
MQQWRVQQVGSIGFVPTMGALHAGHAELIRKSVEENQKTVVSIYVNASQFNESTDFDAYPRTFEADLEIARINNATAIYAPTDESMHPRGFTVHIEPGIAAIPMEGASRPGHFRGVATVVIKLLNAVCPTRAYFGCKDFQQLAVVREVVQALNINTEIVGVPTVRDSDGLALSSRNIRLSHLHRSRASVIFRALTAGLSEFEKGNRCSLEIAEAVSTLLASEPSCVIDYVEVSRADDLRAEHNITSDSVICVAVRFGDVRLIDNIELRHSH